MTYDLTIVPRDGLSPVLRAQVECPAGDPARVLFAEIDHEEETGHARELSRHGANAFCILALAELSIALALEEDLKKTPRPRPFNSHE